MINQWENIPSLQCEYDVEVLCLQGGLSVLDEVKIYPVSLIKLLNYVSTSIRSFLIFHKSDKPIFIVALLVLAISFRIIAFVILWLKGRRTPFKLKHLAELIKRKLKFNRH